MTVLVDKTDSLPIYRAKIKNSHKYITGWFFKTSKASYIIPIARYFSYVEIEESTLSIHTKEMIDSEGKEVFASLNSNGIGSDITNEGKYFVFDSQETIPYYMMWDDFTISSIKEN